MHLSTTSTAEQKQKVTYTIRRANCKLEDKLEIKLLGNNYTRTMAAWQVQSNEEALISEGTKVMKNDFEKNVIHSEKQSYVRSNIIRPLN